MRRNIAFVLALILNIGLLHAAKLDVGSDKIVKVNNTIITVKELEKKYNLLSELPFQEGKKPSKKDVLQMMIQQELMKEEIRNSKNLVLNEEQFKQSIDQYKQVFTYEMKKKDPKFQYSDAAFKAYIENDVKITFDTFEDQVRNQILMQQYIMKKAEKKISTIRTKNYSAKADFPVVFPDGQGGMTKVTSIDDFYDQNVQKFVIPKNIEVKHIFLALVDGSVKRIPDAEVEVKRKKMNDVYKRLAAGEKFDDLCVLYSEDVESRDYKDQNGNYNRGYLGALVRADERVKNLLGEKTFEAIFDIDAGKYSPIMESNVGLHVFYVAKKNNQRLMTLDEARPQIIDLLRAVEQEKTLQDTLNTIISDLKSKASIFYYDEQYKD